MSDSFSKLNNTLAGKSLEKSDPVMDTYKKDVLNNIYGKKDDTKSIVSKLENLKEDEKVDIKLPTKHPLDWKKINKKLVEN